ncbi:MAG: cell division protein FtsL [Pseudomonadota bacterium]
MSIAKRPSLSVKSIMMPLAKIPVYFYLILLCVIVSAFAQVYVSHKIRTLNAELQKQRELQQKLDVEWLNLRLEQSALGEHSRIESIATSELGMQHVTSQNERILAQ